MSKFGLKIVILLSGVVLYVGLFQTEAAAREPTPTEPEVPVLIDGVTIVFRAPTSGSPQVIKVSKDSDGNYKCEQLQGRSVYLPKKTPVFFRVDEVNTALYDVTIRVLQEKPTEENISLLTQLVNVAGAVGILKKIAKDISTATVAPESEKEASDAQKEALDAKKKALEELMCQLEAAKCLNRKLNELLYNSRGSSDNDFDFEELKTQAAKAAKAAFKEANGSSKLAQGTAQEFSNVVNAALAAVHKAYKDENPPDGVPADLSDTSEKAKPVVEVFTLTAKKLRRIEAARWYKEDTQERVLQGQIKYTCIITPAIALPKEYPKLSRTEHVVTVNIDRTPELSGRKLTFGSFITNLHDDTYVKVKDKIETGVQDKFGEGFGILAHIPLYSRNCTKFRWALALSGGVGLDNLSNSQGKFSLTQLPTMLGASVLFAAPKSESLLALTAGGTIRPVERLNGYRLGDALPSSSTQKLTRPVRAFGLFVGITVSYDIREALKEFGNKTKKAN